MESENKIIALNDLGLKLLENNTAHSVFYFNQALLQARCLGKSQNKSKLLAMTYNNLGCYYNAINQPPKALEYFLMSAGLGRLKGSDDKSTAYSHLNIAGILSKQNQHEKALRHALKSIHHLKKLSDNNSNSTITLITAYQVVSMEYLSLDQKTDAKVCYETALSLSTKTLGKTHQKTQELSKFYTETFKPQNKYMKIRTGSVGVKRDLTPSNIQKRLLKTRLLSQMSNIRNTAAVTPVFAKPTNFRSFHVPRIKIDFGYLRNLENYAAIRIQSWWKGIRSRRATRELIILNNIKKAERRAKSAIDEIHLLKEKLFKSSFKTSDENFLNLNELDVFISKRLFKWED